MKINLSKPREYPKELYPTSKHYNSDNWFDFLICKARDGDICCGCLKTNKGGQWENDDYFCSPCSDLYANHRTTLNKKVAILFKQLGGKVQDCDF